MAKVYNSLGQIGSAPLVILQDNKDIFKYISVESNAEEIYKLEALTYINDVPSYVVNEIQSIWFVLLQFAIPVENEEITTPPAKYIYKVANLGKGLYGSAETPIGFNDLELISKENVLVADIENLVGTQIIDFGDIGLTDVWDYLNNEDPSRVLQSQAVGYRLFKTTTADYLFLGPAGTYGQVDLQSSEWEFQELSRTSNVVLSPIAYDGLKILNELDVLQFNVTEELGFKGVTYDTINKRVEINPLVGGAIFVSDTIGNDSTAIIENRSKPFKTLNAAIDAFWLNSDINYIEILDNATYTTNRVLNNGTIRSFELRSEKACTINITTNGVYGYSFGATYQTLTFNLPKAILNLAPTSNTSFGSAGGFPIVNITTATFSVNSFFVPARARELYLKSTNLNINGSTGLVGVTNPVITTIIANTITFTGAGALVGGNAGNTLNIDFNNIVHNSTFTLLQGGSVNTTINHGGISGSYAGANFAYTTNPFGRIDINYKAGFSINTNVSLNLSNSTNVNLTITGICNYVNSDSLFTGNNLLSNTVVFSNANITCKRLASGRVAGGFNFSNSIIKITGTRFAELQPLSIDGGVSNLFADPMFVFEGTNYILCTTDDLNLITYLDVLNNRPSVDISNGVLYTNGKFDRATIDIIENPLNQYYDTIQRQIVIVNEVEEIANQVLDPLKTYFIDGELTLGASDQIIVPATGLNITGYGFDRSIIKSTTAGHVMFKSVVGGSGDLNLDSLTLNATGAGSTYFDLEDIDGFHAVELVKVNFNDGNIGIIDGYRQGLWSNVGLFGVEDGLTFEGEWLGGFRNDQTIIRNFGSSGIVFRKGASTLFKGRFLTDINADLPVGASLSDFDVSNFNTARLYQIKDAQITRAGVIDDTQNYTGTITHNDSVSDWQGNTGIKNSPINPYGIRTGRLSEYASDALATIGGIPVNETYKRPDGLFKINNGVEPSFGGAVDSVNGQVGVVVLDLDDIGDGVTNKAYTQTEKTKLSGIATGATANQSDATTNAAIALKADDAAVVKLAGTQSISGEKTFLTHTNIGNLQTIRHASNSAYFSLNVGSSSASPFLGRNVTGSTDTFQFYNSDSSSTGDITSWFSNVSGVTAKRTRVLKDGTVTAPNIDSTNKTDIAANAAAILTKQNITSQSAITYAANITLDFNQVDAVRIIALTGDLTFLDPSNKAAAKEKTVIITADASTRNLAFPAWTWIGGTAPTTLAAGKTGVLSLYCKGTNLTDVLASYTVEL